MMQRKVKQGQFHIEQIQFLSGSMLKMIAIITMLIDHIGSAILWYTSTTEATIATYHVVRNIGRVSFPIFCFLLVEGFAHTRDVKKYAIRLGIFALISEIPFDLAIIKPNHSYWSHQNVFFTLFIALIVLIGIRYIQTKIPAGSSIQELLLVACVAAGCALAYFMKTDYDYKGVFAIAVLYLLRSERIWQAVTGAICFYWEPWAICAFGPILLYNGKRGFKMKYFFYAFYPVHLLILYYISHFVMHLH